ncbi:amidohydrolase family protein [Parvularcula maris]|uniref:Amidohydrolase family protein n=1 Tax=Parvularcula maris TaxID=2965077 RepID=A0A9X2L7B6_9PROT|nr:amidohydrolase family protein [Parvularcula maris]MCQ8184269.1 amidohydrolase family protein [Parvularcula maris]
MRLLPLLFALLLLAPALAQDKKALVGGRLIDGFGHAPIPDSVILIEGDTIVRVGRTDSLEVPEGYEVISTEGMDVMPGLWESHAHLMLTGHADYPHWQREYEDRFAGEIMPASAEQLLLAGVTSARDLGAPLEASRSLLNAIENGERAGPRLFMSGPFLQAEVEDWQKGYRWAVTDVADAKRKVRRLDEAGMVIVKLVDQDKMDREVAEAIVDQAHARGMIVVAHSHRPDEIRVGLEIGVDNFEHTGLTTAPGYPDDIIEALKERTATGRVAGGPLFWTPTVEGLWNFDGTVANPEKLDDPCWKRGLEDDTIEDIQASIEQPGQLGYTRLTPLRKPTLKNKISQLREAGVVFMVGTDSGIPMKFHCQSTWNEMDVMVRIMELPPMDVIRAAVYWPAVLMGVEDELGTVSAGKKADIIAVRGDVLKHMNVLQNVDLVMKGGTLYKQGGQVNEEAFSSDK